MAIKKTPAIKGKVVILVLGLIILGLGLYSHFQSTWVKTFYFPNLPQTPIMKLYEVCKGVNKELVESLRINASCPSIILEHYFVAIIIICFILALVSLAVSLKMDTKSRNVQMADSGYHVIAALLVIVGGVMYIISAFQITKLAFELGFQSDDTEFKFRKWEKVVAGVLTILWGALHGFMLGLIPVS